jgi:2-polyprenyl-3-methyl-5-hydroxy-6-metoxy-1,4-benzoquinol methylase
LTRETQDQSFRDRLYGSYISNDVNYVRQDAPANWLSEAVSASRARYARSKPALKKNICRHLPPMKEAEILEIGCGQGNVLELAHQLGYQRLRGIDLSGEQVAIARHRGLDHVEEADLFDYLPRHCEAFDAILAIDVIEHFDKPDVLHVMDMIWASLRSGGRLIAQVPNGGSPFGSGILYGDFTHGVAFTSFSARQVLRAVGFREVETYSPEPVPHGLISLARFLLWKLIALQWRAMLAVETGVLRGHIVTQNLIIVATK